MTSLQLTDKELLPTGAWLKPVVSSEHGLGWLVLFSFWGAGGATLGSTQGLPSAPCLSMGPGGSLETVCLQYANHAPQPMWTLCSPLGYLRWPVLLISTQFMHVSRVCLSQPSWKRQAPLNILRGTFTPTPELVGPHLCGYERWMGWVGRGRCLQTSWELPRQRGQALMEDFFPFLAVVLEKVKYGPLAWPFGHFWDVLLLWTACPLRTGKGWFSTSF